MTHSWLTKLFHLKHVFVFWESPFSGFNKLSIQFTILLFKRTICYSIDHLICKTAISLVETRYSNFFSRNSLFQFLKIVIGIRKLSFNSQNSHSLFQKSSFNSQNCHLIKQVVIQFNMLLFKLVSCNSIQEIVS